MADKDGSTSKQPASPSTNDEAVPDGLEGSINDTEPSAKDSERDAKRHAPRDLTDDRPAGNDRRIDDL